jgi:hypothetical protein
MNASARNTFARLPWLTALAEASCVVSLAGFFAANDMRVKLSYHADTAARHVVYIRYEWWERACLDVAWSAALFAVFPLVVLQVSAWALFYRGGAGTLHPLRRLLVWTTIVGLVLAAFFAFAAAASVSGGMIG